MAYYSGSHWLRYLDINYKRQEWGYIMKELCKLEDLQETGAFGADIDGQSYIVTLGEDNLPRVYKNSCPHLGIQLEMMPDHFLDDQRQFIVCANHGALFQIEDGQCVAGPCRNQGLTPVAATLQNKCIFLQ